MLCNVLYGHGGASIKCQCALLYKSVDSDRHQNKTKMYESIHLTEDFFHALKDLMVLHKGIDLITLCKILFSYKS
jgi:hypothetical protein